MSQEKAKSVGIAISKWTKNQKSVVIKAAMPLVVTAVAVSVKATGIAINFIFELYKEAPTSEDFYDKNSTYSKSTPIASRILEEHKYPFDFHV